MQQNVTAARAPQSFTALPRSSSWF